MVGGLTEVPDFDSGAQKIKEWEADVEGDMEDGSWDPNLPSEIGLIQDCIRAAFEFQRDIGCTKFIAPAPSVEDYEEASLDRQLQWMEAADSVAEDMGLESFLLSLAVQDYLLSPVLNPALRAILDNLLNYERAGLYFTPIRNVNSKRVVDSGACSACLYISKVVSEAGREVWFNGIDDLGYLCVSLGATGFATGPYSKQRRVYLPDLASQMGKRFPKFYSHSLIADFHTGRDLRAMQGARLLRYFNADVTDASRDLHQWMKVASTIAPGGMLPSLPGPWIDNQNNDGTAHTHRLQLLNARTGELELLDFDSAASSALKWLQDALAAYSLAQNQIGVGVLDDDFRHLQVWLEAFEQSLDDGSVWS